MSCLVELQQVSKIYHCGTHTYPVLHNINLQIAPGTLTALMGASGSGKSTLMNIIGCLDRCSAGQYFLQGQAVSHLTEQALANIRNTYIGFVFQAFFLLPRATVLQNVMLPLFYRAMNAATAKPLALQMLARVGMQTLAQHYPHQLSGGQQQRVAIARALVGSPALILADEPTGALDSATGNEIMNLFLELHQEGRTILLITHDANVSARCERVIHLKDGYIIAESDKDMTNEIHSSAVSMG